MFLFCGIGRTADHFRFGIFEIGEVIITFQIAIKMSVAGLDFGSHAATIALWYEDTNKVDVIADDLGFRAIPTAVAFRAGEDEVEIITGVAAVTQAHKNPKNTFLDIRALLEDENKETVNVPALDKEISVTELASHFFRNIHEQIKQQVGKPVRDFVVTVPTSLCEEGSRKNRMLEAAQAGGCRIKSTIPDSSAVLNAHGFGNKNANPGVVAVVDLGFSHTEVNIFNCSGGLYFPKGTARTDAMSGAILVKALAGHCAKDFQRKAKFPCDDNKRAMTRLTNVCEEAMKSLSTNSEAMIDIDSLCEGVDYSTKVSKARFEDLGSIPFIQFKNCCSDALKNANLEAKDVTAVVMSGGLSGMPRCQALAKSCFPSSVMHKTRGLENNEAQAYGSAVQGSVLAVTQMMDKPPAGVVNSACMNSSLSLQSNDAIPPMIAMPAGTALPAHYELSGSCPANGGFFKVLVDSNSIGEVVFTPDTEAEQEPVVAKVDVAVDGSVNVEVVQTNTGLIIGTLSVSA
jgi:heat shock 70kDa protein 1/2/6/8